LNITDCSNVVCIFVTPEKLKQLDAYAERNGLTRSEAAEDLFDYGLSCAEPGRGDSF
jgi:hypothetical protein